MPGRLFVVSGPAGAGKGTIVDALRKRRPDIALTVSATTRPPREGEVDGIAYHFLDDAAFDEIVAQDGFLEWANVHGNKYGTLRSEVERCLGHSSVVLEIDPQGAFNVRDAMPDCVLVFIAPPSIEVLRQRLAGRGTETAETFERRMADAVGELECQDRYDEIVVNDDLEDALDQMIRIVEKYEADE